MAGTTFGARLQLQPFVADQADYFLLSGRDDARWALQNMCLRDSWTQFLKATVAALFPSSPG
jgi:hypothetical protein